MISLLSYRLLIINKEVVSMGRKHVDPKEAVRQLEKILSGLWT